MYVKCTSASFDNILCLNLKNMCALRYIKLATARSNRNKTLTLLSATLKYNYKHRVGWTIGPPGRDRVPASENNKIMMHVAKICIIMHLALLFRTTNAYYVRQMLAIFFTLLFISGHRYFG